MKSDFIRRVFDEKKIFIFFAWEKKQIVVEHLESFYK